MSTVEPKVLKYNCVKHSEYFPRESEERFAFEFHAASEGNRSRPVRYICKRCKKIESRAYYREHSKRRGTQQARQDYADRPKKGITVSMPVDLYERVRDAASRHQMSMSLLMLEGIEDYVNVLDGLSYEVD